MYTLGDLCVQRVSLRNFITILDNEIMKETDILLTKQKS